MLEAHGHKNVNPWGAGPALRVAALCALIAAGSLYFQNTIFQCDRTELVQVAEYVFIFFASIACMSLYVGFSGRYRLHRFLALPGLSAVFAALLFAGVYKGAMYQFGGWDEGLLVHAGTYYAHGFRPYLDFPCSMPPLFMAGARAAVMFFGLKWSSFALVSAIYAALTSLWIFALIRRAAMPRHWALAITICVEASTMLTSPFWWYNNTSAVAAVLLILSVLACLHTSNSPLSWVSLSFSLALVLTAKPNTAPVCLVVLALLATRDKLQWTKALAACLGSLGFAALLCYAAQMPPAAVLRSYAQIAQLRASPLRMYPFHQMMQPEGALQAILTALVALCLFALLIAFAQARPIRWPLFAVCAVAVMTSLLMACTNADLKSVDLSLMIVAAAFLCISPDEETKPNALGRPTVSRHTVLAGLLSVFLVMSVFFSVIHLRVLLVIIGESRSCVVGTTSVIKSGFFSGLEAGEHLQAALAQTEKVLARYPNQRVFLGPRLEFAYPVFGRPPIPGMPLLWDTGNLFSREELPNYLLTLQHQQPDLLIFLRGDYALMGPVSFYIQHANTYRRIDGFEGLTVYLRNKDVPITYIKALPTAR